MKHSVKLFVTLLSVLLIASLFSTVTVSADGEDDEETWIKEVFDDRQYGYYSETVVTLDAQGRRAEEFTKESEDGGELLPAIKRVFTYPDEQSTQYSSITVDYWDSEKSEWVTEERDNYTWNEQNKITCKATESYDAESGQWTPYGKEENEYNAAGKMTKRKYSYFSSNAYATDNRTEIDYDEKGNEVEYRYYNGDAAEPSRKYESEYDAEGRISVKTTSAASGGKTLKVFQIETYTYEEGKYTITIKDGAGIPEHKWEYVLSDTGLVISNSYSDYNDGTGNWDPFRKTEFTYDEHGRMTEYRFFEYKNNEFQLYTVATYEYPKIKASDEEPDDEIAEPAIEKGSDLTALWVILSVVVVLGGAYVAVGFFFVKKGKLLCIKSLYPWIKQD